MQQRTFDGEGHRECEQPLPSALGSVISGLGGSNEAELVIIHRTHRCCGVRVGA